MSDRVVSPYHEVTICPACGHERVEATGVQKPVNIKVTFTGDPRSVVDTLRTQLRRNPCK